MARADIPLETLNAYVNGELEPEEAAVVARRAARDPQVAATLSTLQELRAGVAGLASGLGDPPVRLPAARARRPYRAVTVAGLLCLSLVGVGSLVLRSAPETGAAFVEQLIASHDNWAQPPEAVRPSAAVTPDILSLMAATGLRLVADMQHPEGLRQAVFRGERGCRLSLFELSVTPAQSGGRLMLDGSDDLLMAEWQYEAVRYVLMARRMDEVRFATIASSMRAATMPKPDRQDDLIAALADARQRCTS